MRDSGAFDNNLEDLCIKDGGIPTRKVETSFTKQRRERRQQRQPFVMIPMVWVDELVKTKRRATLLVALRLLEKEFKLAKGTPVILSNLIVRDLGVSRQEKWLALGELEAHGLITVERAKRQSPRVTLHQIR